MSWLQRIKHVLLRRGYFDRYAHSEDFRQLASQYQGEAAHAERMSKYFQRRHHCRMASQFQVESIRYQGHAKTMCDLAENHHRILNGDIDE